MTATTDAFDRVMQRITVTEQGCWEYPCRNESGYGVVGEGPRGGKMIRTRNSQRSAYAAIKQAVELLGITHREYRAQFGRSRQAAMKIINEMENAS